MIFDKTTRRKVTVSVECRLNPAAETGAYTGFVMGQNAIFFKGSELPTYDAAKAEALDWVTNNLGTETEVTVR
jgi:hypothetical protein